MLLLASPAGPVVAADVETSPHGFVFQPGAIPVEGAGGEPFFGGLGSSERGPRFRFADLDADQDPDLYVLDRDGRLALLRNDGTPDRPRFVSDSDDLLGARLLDWFLFADIDGDGSLDLFGGDPVGDRKIVYYHNAGGEGVPRFELDPVAAFLDSAQVIPPAPNAPAFADLDRDGDLDLFYVLTDQGRGALHENVGTAQAPLFAAQTPDYGGLDTFTDAGLGPAKDSDRRHGSSFPLFLDLDGDADRDLLIGDLTNFNVWKFRNEGGPDTSVFDMVTPSLLALPADTLFLELFWNDAVDLDGDGRVDLVTGPKDSEGGIGRNLMWYRNTAASGEAEFVYAGDSVLTGLDLGARCAPALADLDGDSDLDLVLSRHVDDGGRGLFLYENVGSAGAPAFRAAGASDPLAAVVRPGMSDPSAAFADLDGDGDLDLAVGEGGFPRQVLYFENQGTREAAEFVFTASLLDGTNVRRRPDALAAPTFGDLDRDGDLDLLVGEFGVSGRPQIYVYRNTGGPPEKGARGRAPIFEWVTSNGDSLFGFDTVADSVTGYLAPLLLDGDCDGYLDIWIGSEDGRLREYRSRGAGDSLRFDLASSGFAGIDVGMASTPAFGDIDADLDLDLFLGEDNGGVNFFRNEGLSARADGAAVVVSWLATPGDPEDYVLSRRVGEEGPFEPLGEFPGGGGGTISVRDTAGIFPGNRYAYRLDAGRTALDCAGMRQADVFLPLPTISLSDVVARLESGGVTVAWRVSETYPGLAFRVARVAGAGEPVVPAGADSLPGALDMAFFDQGATGGTVYRIEALYRAAGPYAAVPDSVFEAVSVTAAGAPPFRIFPPRPNPATGDVSFLFDLPQSADASAEIYDASGRRVRTIGPVSLASGFARTIVWNGEDDEGEPLPAGNYLYRLRAGSSETTGRIVRIR